MYLKNTYIIIAVMFLFINTAAKPVFAKQDFELKEHKYLNVLDYPEEK